MGTFHEMRNRAGLETSERILDATKAILSERGLDGATVKAVCDRAGVRPGSFYNLFDSKEQVVMAVVREAIRGVDPDPAGTGREAVADLVEAFIEFVTSNETLARVYLVMAVTGSMTDSAIADRIARHHAERVRRFGDALGRERSDLDGDECMARADALVAALDGYAIQAVVTRGIGFGEFDFAGHARRLLSFERRQREDTE